MCKIFYKKEAITDVLVVVYSQTMASFPAQQKLTSPGVQQKIQSWPL